MAFGLGMQLAIAQELFTLQTVDKGNFSAKLREKMTNVEKSPVHKRTMYVQVGNLAKIQKNGILTFSVPGGGSPFTFLARRVEAESERDFIWTGVSDEGLYQAFFICKQGKLSGSFTSKHGNYQLYATDEGVSMLMEVDLSKLGECSTVGKASKQDPVKPSGARQSTCQEATRVLVLYTQAAANLVPDINQVVDLGIQQFNSALSNSGIGNQVTNTLVKAGVEYIGFTETSDSKADAIAISQRSDAQALRNQYKADIVLTLTGNVYTDSFGSVGNDIPANYNSAYAVVIANQASLAGAYTFVHETGHLFGGRHDYNIDSNGPSYAHGYAIPNQTTRTIMSVRNNGDLSRILYFSTPSVSVGGTPIGTTTQNDVARRIGEVSPTIVNFQSSTSIPFNAYVSGTSYIRNTGSYQFELIYQCVVPESIEWRVSRDGFTFGSPIGYGDVINPYITSSNNGLYYLRCRITLPGGQVNTLSNYTTVDICNGCRVDQSATTNASIDPNRADENTSLRLTASPNPAAGNARV